MLSWRPPPQSRLGECRLRRDRILGVHSEGQRGSRWSIANRINLSALRGDSWQQASLCSAGYIQLFHKHADKRVPERDYICVLSQAFLCSYVTWSPVLAVEGTPIHEAEENLDIILQTPFWSLSKYFSQLFYRIIILNTHKKKHTLHKTAYNWDRIFKGLWYLHWSRCRFNCLKNNEQSRTKYRETYLEWSFVQKISL